MKRKLVIGFFAVLLTLVTIFLGLLAFFAYRLSQNADAVPTAVTTEEVADGAVTTTGDTPSTAATMPESIVIPVSSLPESQQSVLHTLGYDESIAFTPDMVSCAEAKLGAARVEEIKNGSAPSALEVIKLTPCL